jgi:hypothetical protein
MGNISSWLSGVSERVPGASKSDIDFAVRTIIREFCDKTLLYTRQLTAINLVDGTSTYTLTAPTDCSIVGVERVEVNNMYVDPTSLDLLDRSPENWRQIESSQPFAYTVDAEKVLQFKEIPTESITGGIVVWVSLKPTPITNIVPDFIYDDWYETILNGVVSYLLRMPNKPWTSIEGGEYFSELYDGYVSVAKNKKYTGKAKVSIRVQSAPFSVVG